jgi:hypothetical protein
MVIFSATMLDLRLMEIHLCELLRTRVDLTYDMLRKVIARAEITEKEQQLDAEGKLIYKEQLKTKLSAHYWELYDATLGEVAAECRTIGVPAVLLIIPRVGKADAPPARAEAVARLKAMAGHHALSVYDLSDSFDRLDPASIEIAAWDDHPNALGHYRLFLALARSLVRDEANYRLMFPNSRLAFGGLAVSNSRPLSSAAEQVTWSDSRDDRQSITP